MNSVEPLPSPFTQTHELDDIIGQVQGTLNCISLFTSEDKDSLMQLKEQMSTAKKDLMRVIEENTMGVEVIKARSMLHKVSKVEELVQRAIDGDAKALEEADNIGQADNLGQVNMSISPKSEKKQKHEGVKESGDRLKRAESEIESPRKASRAKDIAPTSQLKELTFRQSLDEPHKEPKSSILAPSNLTVSLLLN
jgi:hypothetical protein